MANIFPSERLIFQPTSLNQTLYQSITIKNNSDTKKTMGSGGGINVTQNLNFAVGITNTVRAEVMNMLPAIQQSTVQAVADAKQRGGKFSKAFGS